MVTSRPATPMFSSRWIVVSLLMTMSLFAAVKAIAGIESLIEPPTPPGQPRSLCGDSISPSSGSHPLDSSHCTERPVEDGVPIAPGFPSSEKQPQWIACPFSTHFLPTVNQGSEPFERYITIWKQKKYLPKSTLESMLQLESVTAYLRETASFSTDAEDEPLFWPMMNGILLERIYEGLRFLCYGFVACGIAYLCFYSEFPGRIRPPCTTMPWTIWPALIVLWGVCWMFYPSPGRAPGAGELESQPHLHHQPQPEELRGEFRFSALDEADLIFPFLEHSSFSDEWWAPHQLNTTYDPLTMTMVHDTGAYPPDPIRQFSPMTTVDPTRSPTDSLHLGSGSQLTLSPGVQQRSQTQGSEPVAVGITENIATTASGTKATNRSQCPQCYKVLSRRDALDRHQRSQHNRGVEEQLCPHKPCKHSRQGSGFARRDGLRRHLKACKSRPRRAITVALDSVDSQLDSENETRGGSQVRSSNHHAHSSEHPNDTSDQQSSADSLILGLRKRLAEAEAARDRAKREYEEAQQKVANYKVTIETLEKERTA